jgi:hypothetical protein
VFFKKGIETDSDGPVEIAVWQLLRNAIAKATAIKSKDNLKLLVVMNPPWGLSWPCRPGPVAAK